MNILNQKYFSFFLLFIFVFISRLPFIYAGYGVEEDSWGIALEAYNSHTTGIFEPSRLPGHPVQELIYTALWGKGAFLFNLLCAFFSAVATVFFALILKQLNFKHFFIASLAFAFAPVFYISSTYTIDFVWTEAFVLISLYFLLNNKFILTGIFLGLAVGCRITSGAMLLPFIIIFWQERNLKENIIRFLKIILPMIVVAISAFIPIIQKYGLSFFMYYDQFPYPPITKLLYKMILGVWGFVGTIAIGIAVITIILTQNKIIRNFIFDKNIIIASFTIIVLYIISYLRLPQKPGYMIPIIPFVILLFGNYLNAQQFKFLCYSFIISSFVCSINLTDKLRGSEYSKFAFTYNISGQEIFFDAFSGPLFSDYSKRKQKMKYTNEVIEKIEKIKSKTVIVAGWWYNEIMVTMIEKTKNQFVILEPYIDSTKINEYLAMNYKISYLPEQNIYNDLMYKMNITNKISTPFE